MAKKRQYSSVSELLRDVAPDDQFRAEFDQRVARRRLIKHLLALRAAKGLSQKDIAEKLGCTQSRVSKLENADDDDVRLGDLRAYANAVGSELITSPVPRDVKPVDKVKCHVFAIKRHMDELAELAKSDDEIAKGVASFFGELFINFVWMLGDSARRLPLRPDESPYLDIRIAGLESDEEDSPIFCPGEAESASQAAR